MVSFVCCDGLLDSIWLPSLGQLESDIRLSHGPNRSEGLLMCLQPTRGTAHGDGAFYPCPPFDKETRMKRPLLASPSHEALDEVEASPVRGNGKGASLLAKRRRHKRTLSAQSSSKSPSLSRHSPL